ncbi:MAG TPA: diguanylate cyclase [Chloroflexota bacterium]|nr:diguanylate cyclase [Chloroflexota bacterium]
MGQYDDLLADAGPFRALFDHSPDGMVLLDPHDPNVVCPIVACNESAARMNGYERAELIGKPISLITRDPDSHAELETYLHRLREEGVISEEDIHYRRNGSEFPIEFSTVMVTIGDREFILGVDRDITRRKLLEEALARQAMYDSLTDLPNRAYLRNQLSNAIDEAAAGDGTFALLFLDLDGFKDINDTFGHHMGDELLKDVADRVVRIFGQKDTVARLGGDEFAIVLPGAGRAEAARAMRAVVGEFLAPFHVCGKNATVGVSIGCSNYPHDGMDAAALMRHADAAMYVAKRAGLGFATYSSEHTLGQSAHTDTSTHIASDAPSPAPA